MSGFIKNVLVVAMTIFSFNVLSVNSLERISMKNQECKVREEVINVNINNPVFHPCSANVNKCSGNCYNINDPYATLHSINFTENNKNFCLRLHYNGANNYLFVNGTEIHKFKAKDSEMVSSPLCHKKCYRFEISVLKH